MAEEEEKTEEPTSKKLEDAKKQGNVAKSQDVSGFVTLLIGIASLALLLGFMGQRLVNLYLYFHSLIGSELDIKSVQKMAVYVIFQVLLIVLPISIIIMFAGIMSNIMQFGFLFTTEPLIPKLSKINPISGLKNLFSIKKIIDGIKIILKVSAVFGVAFYFFLKFITELPHTIFLSISKQLGWLQEKMLILCAVILLLFLILAIADFFIVRYQYFKSLRMSKQEVKDEFKQMEGDPKVKGRIRSLQMQAARKRMMQNIPTADVVITNPTHYAVALRYDKTKEKAPVIVAKGVDFLAFRIKDIAVKNGVQIVENPPLARELYRLCDVDTQIPANLFQAVAEVLSFVYLSNKQKFAGKLN